MRTDYRRDARTAMKAALLAIAVGPIASAPAQDAPQVANEQFAADPDWDGFRNRLLPESPRIVRQDFGYRRTNHAGGKRSGEIGGFAQRSSTSATYARRIAPKTLEDRLSAAGKMSVRTAEGASGVMIGWFRDTPQGWRTPNSLGMRIDGNGGKYWVFYEYGTQGWRTGGAGAFEGEQYQKTRTPPFPADGAVHDWAIDYDPAAAAGQGQITFRIDERTYQLPLALGHRADGAMFNRFGIWNVQTPGNGVEFYFDDLSVDGRLDTFDDDPQWEASGNPAEFNERIIRPYHDFGYSPTKYAGGAVGEIGGVVFRDERPAFYAANAGRLSLDDALSASGKLALRKAASDSGFYIGWFDSSAKRNNETPESSQRQKSYLGVLIEGPSRIGHYFRPGYGASDASGSTAGETTNDGRRWPVIYPDGRVHTWSIRYEPSGAGRIELSYDGQAYPMDLKPGHKKIGATFDRFGIFNMQSGGHHVELYLDDVSFSRR